MWQCANLPPWNLRLISLENRLLFDIFFDISRFLFQLCCSQPNNTMKQKEMQLSLPIESKVTLTEYWTQDLQSETLWFEGLCLRGGIPGKLQYKVVSWISSFSGCLEVFSIWVNDPQWFTSNTTDKCMFVLTTVSSCNRHQNEPRTENFLCDWLVLCNKR